MNVVIDSSMDFKGDGTHFQSVKVSIDFRSYEKVLSNEEILNICREQIENMIELAKHSTPALQHS